MRKILLGVTAFVLAGGVALATQDNQKVWVCKYVGTPSVDETLKDGKNPISVSVNSIKDFNGVGSYFNDKQGRSFVVALDTGQEVPPTCPTPQNDPVTPPPVETTPPPTTTTQPPVETFVGK